MCFYSLIFTLLLVKSSAALVPSKQELPQWSQRYESLEKRIPKSLPLVTPSLVDTFVAYHMGPYGSQMIPLTRETLADFGSKM